MKTKLLSSLFILSLLIISCSKDDDSSDTSTNDKEVETVETIVSYSDITFDFADSDSSDPQYFFSTSTGTSYKASEITSMNVASIDIASFTLQAFIAFESPDDAISDIDGVTITKFQHTDVTLTAEQFDAITDDSGLKDLTVVGDFDSISINDYKNAIILFENASGKKGAIKVTGVNAEKVTVDIKAIK